MPNKAQQVIYQKEFICEKFSLRIQYKNHQYGISDFSHGNTRILFSA